MVVYNLKHNTDVDSRQWHSEPCLVGIGMNLCFDGECQRNMVISNFDL